MSRKKLADRKIRKLFKRGNSIAITLPIEIVRKLKLRKTQKMVVKSRGNVITIRDWEK